MAGLFVIYLVCLALLLWQKENKVFALAIINLILCFLMLLHHATGALNIRL